MYADRAEAGRQLAETLRTCVEGKPIVLGLARGGVPVAVAVARALSTTAGMITAFRIPVPGHPETAVGAVARGVRYIDVELARVLEISDSYFDIVARELELQIDAAQHADVRNQRVIIVDDGIASGCTAAAAIQSVRLAGATHVTMAAPMASRRGLDVVGLADQVVVPLVVDGFTGVSEFYEDFTQVSAADVANLMREFSAIPAD